MDDIDKILKNTLSQDIKSPQSYKAKIKETINSLEPQKRIYYRNNFITQSYQVIFKWCI